MKGKWRSLLAASVVLTAWAATVQADLPPVTLWARQIGTSDIDTGRAIAVDGSGNSYMAGCTHGDLGGPNQGNGDVFIVKHDSGGTLQWASQMGTGASDGPYGIAVDGSGNSYVTGHTHGDLAGPNQGGFDAFILKYDSGGTEQWRRQIGGSDSDGAYGIAVDAGGNSYITGYTFGDLAGPNQGSDDAFIVKYDSAGTEQWRRQMGTSGADRGKGIAVDASGNSYITGYTDGDLGAPNQGSDDVFVTKYDSAGTVQWATQIGTNEIDCAEGITVDAGGNSYITGYTFGDLAGPGHGDVDAIIVACDGGGTVQWVRQLGTAEGDAGTAIAVDGAGNSYVTGLTGGDLGGPNQGETDVFVLACDSGGTLQWTRQMGSSRGDSGNGIAVDASGRSYIAGDAGEELAGPYQGLGDAFVAAIGPTPAEVCLDIKPGSWPNPLNPKSRGVLPLAVCGSDEFDVMTIDPETILLGREGVYVLQPIRWSYGDVATPFEGEPCDGHNLNGDGFMDLTLKFSTQDVVSVLGLDLLAGDTVPLLLAGGLTDGTWVAGRDCVWVLMPGDGNMDGLVNGLDYIAWSNHYRTGAAWSEGDYTGDGIVDGLDYVIWSNNYKRGCPAAVPEPAALALLALGALALLRRRSAQMIHPRRDG